MIRLDVMPQCHSCPEFEVIQTGPEIMKANGRIYDVSDTFISCRHQDFCKNVVEHCNKWLAENTGRVTNDEMV